MPSRSSTQRSSQVLTTTSEPWSWIARLASYGALLRQIHALEGSRDTALAGEWRGSSSSWSGATCRPARPGGSRPQSGRTCAPAMRAGPYCGHVGTSPITGFFGFSRTAGARPWCRRSAPRSSRRPGAGAQPNMVGRVGALVH